MSDEPKERLRLRRVVDFADFRKSEATNLELLEAEDPEFVKSLRGDDCVMFISNGGNLVMFVHGFRHVADLEGRVAVDRRILASRKLRIEPGVFNPRMLANYAEQVGLQLEGRTKYDQAHKLRQLVMRERRSL